MSDEADPQPPPRGMKLHQITEDDLAALERILPQWQDVMFDRMDNRLRTQIRQVQQILSGVRWGYGPPGEVHTIPA
jgi:hypothetical protein